MEPDSDEWYNYFLVIDVTLLHPIRCGSPEPCAICSTHIFASMETPLKNFHSTNINLSKCVWNTYCINFINSCFDQLTDIIKTLQNQQLNDYSFWNLRTKNRFWALFSSGKWLVQIHRTKDSAGVRYKNKIHRQRIQTKEFTNRWNSDSVKYNV